MQIKRKISREIAEEPESNEDDQLEGLSKKNEVKFRGPKKKSLLKKKRKLLHQRTEQRQASPETSLLS
jgi:hypothetical protein